LNRAPKPKTHSRNPLYLTSHHEGTKTRRKAEESRATAGVANLLRTRRLCTSAARHVFLRVLVPSWWAVVLSAVGGGHPGHVANGRPRSDISSERGIMACPGRARSGSNATANRSLYWQGRPGLGLSKSGAGRGAKGRIQHPRIRVALVRFRPKLAPAGKRPHARSGRPGCARRRGTSFELAANRVTPRSKVSRAFGQRKAFGGAGPWPFRGWSGEISGLDPLTAAQPAHSMSRASKWPVLRRYSQPSHSGMAV